MNSGSSKVCYAVLIVFNCYSLFSDAVSNSCSQTLSQDTKYYADCKSAFDLGARCSGVYTIKPDKQPPFEVYCDMETDGGGWTVFQRRMDGTQSFSSSSDSYVSGFGQLDREFWLNLNNIHRLTMLSGVNTTLRVDMDDFDGNSRFAKYSTFQILNADADYLMMVSGYSGDAGDSLASSGGEPFSFFSSSRGAWWRNSSRDIRELNAVNRNESHFANLNGLYQIGQNENQFPFAEGVYWSSWRGTSYSLKFTEMKLRRESPAAALNSANQVMSSVIFVFIAISFVVLI